MPFQTVAQVKRKATYVADQIISVIKGGEYQIGDKLPSERDIAEQMKVSRNSVREALSALQIMGIIESRAGTGTYIRRSTTDIGSINQALEVVRETPYILEMWKAREQMEIFLAKRAIDQASQESIDAIQAIITRMKDSDVSNNDAMYFEMNKAFHLTLAKIANAPELATAVFLLMEITTQRIARATHDGYGLQFISRSVIEHQHILDALRARDKKDAVAAINAHYGETHFKELGRYLDHIHSAHPSGGTAFPPRPWEQGSE